MRGERGTGEIGRKRMLCGLVVLCAFAGATAPSQAAAKPKGKKTQITNSVYSANESFRSKRIYKGDLLDVKASCAPGEVPALTVITKTKNTSLMLTGVRSTDESVLYSSSSNAPGAATTYGDSDSVGFAQLYDANKRIAAFDFVTLEDALGKDCLVAVSMTRPSRKDSLFFQSENISESTPKGSPVTYGLTCNGFGSRSFLGSSTSSNPPEGASIGSNFFYDQGLRSRSFTPFGDDDVALFGPGLNTIGDVVYIDRHTTVSSARVQVRGPLEDGNPCTAAGVTRQVKGEYRAGFLSTGTGPDRSPVYQRNGLKLTALCSGGVMTLYGSTAKPGAALEVSAYGDSDPAHFTVADFSATEADPEPLLIFGGITRSGQITYVSAKSKVVSLNYFAGVNTDTAPCMFSGYDAAAG